MEIYRVKEAKIKETMKIDSSRSSFHKRQCLKFATNKIEANLVWSRVQVSLVVLPQSPERLLHPLSNLLEIRQRRCQLPILPVQL